MPHSPHSGRVAALSRRCSADDPRLLDARRDLAAHQIEQFIGRVTIRGSLLLRPDQRARIAAVLDGRVVAP